MKDLTITIYSYLSNSINTVEMTFLTVLLWLSIASLLSILGGAIGGILLAGKYIGNSLAARIGGLYGPLGVMPAMIFSLIIFTVLR